MNLNSRNFLLQRRGKIIHKTRTIDEIYQQKKVTPFGNHGNILLFGGMPQDAPKYSNKRKDPNERTKSSEIGSKLAKKNNRMFKESNENTLKFG